MRATIGAMASRKRKVLDEALKLPAKERAEIAGKLLQSLDAEESMEDPQVVEATWAAEVARRARDLDTGRVKGLSRAEARKIVIADPRRPVR